MKPAGAHPVAAVAVATFAVFSLVGCQSASPSGPDTAVSTPTPSGSPASSASPSASPSAPAAPDCVAVDLTVTLGAGKGAGAGHRYPYLVFTNDSAEPCVLSGHPSVAMVGGGNGVVIGAKAKPVSSSSKKITLKPGKSAHAPLDVASAENYDPASCQPQLADGLRVVVPGDAQNLFVATTDYVGCANASISLMTVKPFAGGAK